MTRDGLSPSERKPTMDTRTPPRDPSPGMNYVRSLKDAVKRRYATDYLLWIRAGRNGSAPSRGLLSPTDCKSVCTNLDALA